MASGVGVYGVRKDERMQMEMQQERQGSTPWRKLVEKCSHGLALHRVG